MSHPRSSFTGAHHDRGVRPVIRFLLLCSLILTASCTRLAAERCDFTHSREIAFTGGPSADRVIVRTFGASCDKAIGVYEILDGESAPIWAWAMPLPRAFGDTFTAEDPDHVVTFLERWSQPAITTTTTAPPWESLPPGQTTLDEFTYNDIRARDLPMLCHFSGTARETCVFWEPVAGGAGHFLDRDVQETTE